jgi:hypothetical protein
MELPVRPRENKYYGRRETTNEKRQTKMNCFALVRESICLSVNVAGASTFEGSGSPAFSA